MQITRLLFPTMLTMLLVFSSILSADNNGINGHCPGEIIEEMDGANVDTTWIENGRIGGWGNDRYRMTFPVAGTLSINLTNRNASRNANYYFYVSNTTCDNWNIINREYGRSHSTTVTVDAGDTIWVRMQAIRSQTPRGQHDYALSLTFTPTTATVGCDSSLDTLANSSSPYTVIPQMHNIIASVNTCISGSSTDSDASNKEDIYYFTVNTAGTLSLNTSSPNSHPYHLRIGNSAGGSQYYGDNTAQSHNISTINLSVGDTVYLFFKETGNNEDHYEMNLNFTAIPKTPPVMGNIPNQTAIAASPYNLGIASFVTEADGDPLTYNLTCLPNGLSFNVNSGLLDGTPSNAGTYNCSASATDSDGTSNIDNFILTVTAPPLVATPNTYTTTPGTAINGNFISDDTGAGIDSGANIIASTTSTNGPSLGTVTINTNGTFTYTPNNNNTGIDTFVYTITDANGNTATATVSINIGTNFTTGSFLNFTLINPPNTRNVIGNYKIAGNTVLCLTGRTTGYGGTCTDIALNTSNGFVSKYLDIDDNPGTWNSSSSFINIDAPYNPARGIIWAGLFWGGRISTDKGNPIRYAIANGSNAFTTRSVGNGSTIPRLSVATTAAPNIKIKIDSGNYTDILASTFHTSRLQNGETYAAFSDITATVQAANLGLGKHTFTVANLTTMEGREASPGAFGGWSIVVIYAEDYANGKPRNVSIYNGFIRIGRPSAPIKISGFKLPTVGDVQAQLSVFSGEGEYLFGRNTTSNDFDWMKISNKETSDYDYMPGVPAGRGIGNRDNMFDAHLDGILRDHIPGEYNDLSNNNVGVDVDNYDVSSLMKGYRDNDENISSVYIQMSTSNDYITPSMMAFSAELYIPNLCYDYTLDIDGHVLTSTNNEIDTPFGGFGKDLTTAVYLRSEEGDIPLSNMVANYSISDSTQLSYHDCTTEISETGEFDYSDACAFTHNVLNSGFSMYIGTGKTTTSGGVIAALENRYIKFDSTFHRSRVNTSFEFSLDYTVNYGSGAVPLRKIFTENDLCPPVNNGYFPQPGLFNITDAANDFDEWNLYTQVSRRAFNLNIYAYDATSDFTTALSNDLNLSVEVEMIRADNFIRDAATACNDAHSILSDVPAKFVHFNESKGETFNYNNSDVNLAYRSASMRVWYLTDVNGTMYVDNHDCTRNNQSECINLYNREYVSGLKCSTECRSFNSTGNCYDCLRTSYGNKVCSRDNFAIRPESFLTTLIDSNESTNTDDTHNVITNSIVPVTPFGLVAGYNYRFDINATNHIDNQATPRYLQHFSPGSTSHRMSMNWFPNGNTVTGCNDVDDKNISIDIFNGSSVNDSTKISYIDKVDQIGQYSFATVDFNWTSVDWNDNQLLHHTHPSFSSYYKTDNNGKDCRENISAVSSVGSTVKQGCVIRSQHINVDAGIRYVNLIANYYPYTFSVNGLLGGARPTNDQNLSTFVYINSLNPANYPNGVDENMSYNIQGTFTATGKEGLPVSNFVNNCYAANVDMSLYQFYNHAAPANVPFLTYDLIDYNTSNPGTIIRPRGQGTFAQTNSATTNPLKPLVVVQAPTHFTKDMNGSITMDLGYNFLRQNNNPLNPRLVIMKDFNLTYTTPPPSIFVDLQTNYRIFGNKTLDQNISFLYARAKPGQRLYDDIVTASVNTPVSVTVYCDLGFAECARRNIVAAQAQTNEAEWWKSWNHDNIVNQDGNIQLVSTPTTALNTTNVLINSRGEANDIIVSRGATPPPVTIPVDLVWNNPATPPTPALYTDRWLIYNPDNANTPPDPFYRVRFIGASGWTGTGKTGHVVGGNSNVKKNKRLEW